VDMHYALSSTLITIACNTVYPVPSHMHTWRIYRKKKLIITFVDALII